MRDLHFKTKTHQAWAGIVSTADRGNFVFVHIRSSKTGRELNNYKLPAVLAEQVQNIKSYTALVKYAKANQITDSASDADSGSDSASVTPCPAPAPAPAKSAAKGQGILFVEVDTIGRGKKAEIIEISVVDSSSKLVYFSKIKPSNPQNVVPSDSPSFASAWKSFSDAIGRADIAFYNADHSKRMILQSIAKAFDTPMPEHFRTLFPYNEVICVGERYKDFNNYRLGYFRNYGLQHINSACGQSGIQWRDLSNRSAGNAIKCSRLYKYLEHKAVA